MEREGGEEGEYKNMNEWICGIAGSELGVAEPHACGNRYIHF